MKITPILASQPKSNITNSGYNKAVLCDSKNDDAKLMLQSFHPINPSFKAIPNEYVKMAKRIEKASEHTNDALKFLTVTHVFDEKDIEFPVLIFRKKFVSKNQHSLSMFSVNGHEVGDISATIEGNVAHIDHVNNFYNEKGLSSTTGKSSYSWNGYGSPTKVFADESSPEFKLKKVGSSLYELLAGWLDKNAFPNTPSTRFECVARMDGSFSFHKNIGFEDGFETLYSPGYNEDNAGIQKTFASMYIKNPAVEKLFAKGRILMKGVRGIYKPFNREANSFGKTEMNRLLEMEKSNNINVLKNIKVLLNGRDNNIKNGAVEALGENGQLHHLQLLEPLKRDEDYNTRTLTDEAILKIRERFANLGDVESQTETGKIYFHLVNREKALYWLTKAAEQDHDEAQYFLGQLLMHKLETFIEGKDWMKKAAEKEHEDAIFWMSRLGDTKNQMFWLDVLAKKGNSKAQLSLGRDYKMLGDKKLAAFWLKKAEAQGEKDATYLLREIGDLKDNA